MLQPAQVGPAQGALRLRPGGWQAARPLGARRPATNQGGSGDNVTLTAEQLKKLLADNARSQQAEAEKLAQKAAQQAAQQALATLMPAVHALLAQGVQQPAPQPVSIQDQVEAALERALSNLAPALAPGASTPATRGAQSPAYEESSEDEPDGSDPVFIPQGIVKRGEPTPEIKVSSSSSEGSGLGDSAAALKRIRKK